jgi:divalent metal cation (Fe/Co/Zn/Cd) transporter
LVPPHCAITVSVADSVARRIGIDEVAADVLGAEIESTAVKADAWHHLSDAITSGLAFIGITTALLSRNAGADDWAALCTSPIIVFNGIRQLLPPIGELLDTAPPADINDEVRRA